jgi:hypothetical protein
MYRVAIAFALAALALPATSPAQAQGIDLGSVVLTQADVPGGLRLDLSRSGPQARGGTPAYGWSSRPTRRRSRPPAAASSP